MKISSILFIIVLTTANCRNNQASNTRRGQIEIEKVKLTNLKGESIDLKQFKGKVLFINYWATWCKPCVEEMPAIKRTMDSLKKSEIEFLFATEDSNEEIEKFESAHKFGFNYVRVASLAELNIMGLPTTFIFDKNGRQAFSEIGYRKWDDKPNLDLLSKIINER